MFSARDATRSYYYVFYNKKLKKNITEKLNDINVLKNIEKNLREKVIIKGVNNIKNVTMRQEQNSFVKKDKSYVQEKEWVLDTDGLNLQEIMNHPKVDELLLNKQYNLLFQIFHKI